MASYPENPLAYLMLFLNVQCLFWYGMFLKVCPVCTSGVILFIFNFTKILESVIYTNYGEMWGDIYTHSQRSYSTSTNYEI